MDKPDHHLDRHPDRSASPGSEPGSPSALDRLRDLYRELDAEIASAGVPCILRGSCCDFDTSPHVLYASTLEVEYFARTSGKDARPVSGRLCPYWVERRCTAREGRPLGCRVYFCDPAWNTSGKSSEVYERYHARLKDIAVQAQAEGVLEEWLYAPFVEQLAVRFGRVGEP